MPRPRLLVILTFLVLLGAQAERDKRSYGGAGRVILEIDGIGSAAATSITGGNVTADVISEPASGLGATQKHLGAVRVVPVTVEVAAGDLLPWISQTLNDSSLRVNGRILELDAGNSIVVERQFNNAVLTEVAFPALDGSSKEAARVKLTFQPQNISTKPASGGAKAPSIGDAKAKRPMVSAFRVTIPGVDCTGVARVEPITITFKGSNAASGGGRDAQGSKQSVETVAGDLVLLVADSKAGGFTEWHDRSVVRGETSNAEKTATVELLTPDLKNSMLTLEGQGVGIVTVRQPATTPGAEPLRRVEAQMYVEQWRVK